MADDGSASNPRDPVKSSVWNVAVQRRRQKAVMVSKKIRKVLIRAKRLRKVGTKGDDAAEMMIDEEQPILDAHTNIAVEELKSAVQNDHFPKELDPKTIDTSKGDEIVITSSMASSSSGSRRHDVFPSFSGEDVRSSFLSHLLKELYRRLITTFIDHKIERSRPIGPELISAITESRIAIVVFSKNYASSTWCLNELVQIHECYKELNQMVIPIFYNVDPSDVRKQTGEFGKAFNKTCEGKKKDEKQRWMKALTDVANLAGEDLQNWPDEAALIEKIANDVLNKLITASDDSGDFVGIEAHIEAINPILCLESEEARMVGIVGPSGIGKTTIARALYSLLSSQFHHHAFVTYNKRTIPDDYGMRLCWEEQFLSKILRLENIEIKKLGVVKQRLKDKKVLIVLDDVDDLELLNTLVGKPEWFGPGSRIIVITQNRWLLKAHKIDRIYEVEFPSEDLALKMLCRSAFEQNSPPGGFMELAVEVARLAGNLPLGLRVLGSSLKGRDKDEWIEMLPRFRNDLDGKIEKVLRVGYDRLHYKDQELFLYLAFGNLFNGKHVNYVRDLLGDSVAKNGLKMLAEKSLIRITPAEYVEMHNLLQSLGREIVRAESINKPGERRFLEDVEDIRKVLTNKIGTQTVLGIRLNTSDLNQPLYMHKKAFKHMHNLQFLIICTYLQRESEVRLNLLRELDCLPCNLRLLEWGGYPSKCLPYNFKAEFLVELRMENSKLEKMWEGTQTIRNLKWMDLSSSSNLKELPDLSTATNLEKLNLGNCSSLAELPSSIGNAINLVELDLSFCTSLVELPSSIWNAINIVKLNLCGCTRLVELPSSTGSSINLAELNFRFFLKLPELQPFIGNAINVQTFLLSIERGTNPRTLNLKACSRLKEQLDMGNATNLEQLDLTGSLNMLQIKSSIHTPAMNLSKTGLRKIPRKEMNMPLLLPKILQLKDLCKR